MDNFLNYGNMQGFKIPYDMNNDGFEMVHIEFGNTHQSLNVNGNIEIFEFSFDNDNDEVLNQNNYTQMTLIHSQMI